jgi:hypothetical protein
VGIATRLMGWTIGVRFLAVARSFSLRHRVQTGSGAHPTSSPVGTGVLSPGVKRPGREADHSSSSSAKVENVLSSAPPYAFTAWCLVKHRDNRTLPFP